MPGIFGKGCVTLNTQSMFFRKYENATIGHFGIFFKENSAGNHIIILTLSCSKSSFSKDFRLH